MFHGLQADNRDLPCDLETMRKKDRVPVLRRARDLSGSILQTPDNLGEVGISFCGCIIHALPAVVGLGSSQAHALALIILLHIIIPCLHIFLSLSYF